MVKSRLFVGSESALRAFRPEILGKPVLWENTNQNIYINHHRPIRPSRIRTTMRLSDLLIGTVGGAILLSVFFGLAKLLQILTRRRPITPGRLMIWGFPLLFLAISALLLMDPASRQSGEQVLDRVGVALIFSAPLLAWRLIFVGRYDVTEIGPTPIGATARLKAGVRGAASGSVVTIVARSPDNREFEVRPLDDLAAHRSLPTIVLPKDAIEIIKYDERQIAGGSRYPIRKGTVRFSYLMAAVACVCGAGWYWLAMGERTQAVLKFLTLSSAGYAVLAFQVAQMLPSTRWDRAEWKHSGRSREET